MRKREQARKEGEGDEADRKWRRKQRRRRGDERAARAKEPKSMDKIRGQRRRTKEKMDKLAFTERVPQMESDGMVHSIFCLIQRFNKVNTTAKRAKVSENDNALTKSIQQQKRAKVSENDKSFNKVNTTGN